MALRKRTSKKEETKVEKHEPVSEDIFAEYQNRRMKASEGIIVKELK